MNLLDWLLHQSFFLMSDIFLWLLHQISLDIMKSKRWKDEKWKENKKQEYERLYSKAENESEEVGLHGLLDQVFFRALLVFYMLCMPYIPFLL